MITIEDIFDRKEIRITMAIFFLPTNHGEDGQTSSSAGKDLEKSASKL